MYKYLLILFIFSACGERVSPVQLAAIDSAFARANKTEEDNNLVYYGDFEQKKADPSMQIAIKMWYPVVVKIRQLSLGIKAYLDSPALDNNSIRKRMMEYRENILAAFDSTTLDYQWKFVKDDLSHLTEHLPIWKDTLLTIEGAPLRGLMISRLRSELDISENQ